MRSTETAPRSAFRRVRVGARVQTIPDRRLKLFQVERLRQHAVDVQLPDRLQLRGGEATAADENAAGVICGASATREFNAIDPGQVNVEDQQIVGAGVDREMLPAFDAIGE